MALATGSLGASADSRADRAPEPAIRVVDVRVSFPRPHEQPVTALDGLTLDVAAGQVVALIGPNGSGKSTLLRTVGGLIRPGGGHIELGGRPVVGPDPAVGFVFQEPRLLAWRSVLDNVAFPLELAGVGRADRETRAHELLGVVGLERSAADRPHRLSGGMRQRASIARALALDPAILLLDEPFSALDALTRERFDIELLALWDRLGRTVLLVTHDVREALVLADRVVVLSSRPGRVLADIESPLPRPRSAASFDDPRLDEPSAEIRRHLAATSEEGWTSAGVVPR